MNLVFVLYLLGIMILTPVVFELINTKIAASSGAVKLQSLPAYVINLILCGVEAVIGLVAIPDDYSLSLWNVLIFTALIYFVNQFIFNVAVKTYSRARSSIQHGGAIQ